MCGRNDDPSMIDEDCAYCPLGIVPGQTLTFAGHPAHPECADALMGYSAGDLAAVRAAVTVEAIEDEYREEMSRQENERIDEAVMARHGFVS